MELSKDIKNIGDYDARQKNLVDGLIKDLWDNTDVQNYCEYNDVKSFITHPVYFIFFRGEKAEKPTIEECIDTEVNKFSLLLDELPYEYEFYFKLPFELPEGLRHIDICQEARIINLLAQNPDLYKSVRSKKLLYLGLSAFSEKKMCDIEERDAFMVIRATGFQSYAQSKAITLSIANLLNNESIKMPYKHGLMKRK